MFSKRANAVLVIKLTILAQWERNIDQIIHNGNFCINHTSVSKLIYRTIANLKLITQIY